MNTLINPFNRLQLALLGLIFLLTQCGGGNEGSKVLVEKTSRRSITEKVSVSGSIEALDSRVVSAENSGRITSIHVDLGQQVDSGDLLLSIDAELYTNNLDLAKSNLNQRRAGLSRAQAYQSQAEAAWRLSEEQLNVQVNAYEKGLISQTEFDAFQSNHIRIQGEYESSKHAADEARYLVRAAENSINDAKNGLARTSIYAPAGGVITELNVHEGETIVGTAQMQGSNLLTITNFDTLLFRAEVSESDIPRIHLGDSAKIVLDAYPGKTIFAKVWQLPLSPKQGIDLSNQFEVVLMVSPERLEKLETSQEIPLRPGMRGNASVFTNRVEDVLSVPLQCVTVRPNDEGVIEDVVFVYTNGKAAIQQVVTGIQDEQYIEIVGGLEEGASVISGPYDAIANTLENNSAVLRVKEEELFQEE
ncbi:MAG: efflux RND transporter periplasmic adaptor subunit [Bacteroidota bacterium]|nr:efflux RND transporter periplasmic adaptor subunit [Bacteroidota bacterium]